jgi:hypothetical protein
MALLDSAALLPALCVSEAVAVDVCASIWSDVPPVLSSDTVASVLASEVTIECVSGVVASEGCSSAQAMQGIATESAAARHADSNLLALYIKPPIL